MSDIAKKHDDEIDLNELLILFMNGIGPLFYVWSSAWRSPIHISILPCQYIKLTR